MCLPWGGRISHHPKQAPHKIRDSNSGSQHFHKTRITIDTRKEGKFIRTAIRFEKWHHFPLLISLCKFYASFFSSSVVVFFYLFLAFPFSLALIHGSSVCLYLVWPELRRSNIAFNFCARRNFHIIKAFGKSLHNNVSRIEFNACDNEKVKQLCCCTHEHTECARISFCSHIDRRYTAYVAFVVLPIL